MRRDSFVFYRSFFEMAEEIANEGERLRALEALLDYGLNGKVRKLQKGSMSSVLFGAFKPQIDANNERYLNGKKGAEHGAKGGRPKKDKNPTGVTEQNPTGVIRKTPNENVNVNANVNANVHVNENENVMGSSIGTELSDYIRGIERKRKELAND